MIWLLQICTDVMITSPPHVTLLGIAFLGGEHSSFFVVCDDMDLQKSDGVREEVTPLFLPHAFKSKSKRSPRKNSPP